MQLRLSAMIGSNVFFLSRQEVVAALVSSLSSPLPREVDGALAVLGRISDSELALRIGRPMDNMHAALPPYIINRAAGAGAMDAAPPPDTTLVNFLPFLKSVLDDVEVFSVNQTRALFK